MKNGKLKRVEEPEDDPFQIDLFNLEKQWARHAGNFKRASEKLTEARDLLDRAKRKLDVTEAETMIAISKDPASYELEKSTVDIIKAAVQVQPEVEEANEEFFKCKRRVGIHAANVEAYSHMKHALENEVQLLIAGYWSVPKTPKGATREDAEKVVKRRKE